MLYGSPQKWAETKTQNSIDILPFSHDLEVLSKVQYISIRHFYNFAIVLFLYKKYLKKAT